MEKLNLTKVTAYTVYSSDSDITSSEKGYYKNYNIASTKCKKVGWFGFDGEVREKKDVYSDENGELYIVKHVGQFTDVSEKYREDIIAQIKSKLTKEELGILGIH